MTYNTPELLLVGAAQNVVLGEWFSKIQFSRNSDTPDADVYADNVETPDHEGW